MYAGRQNISRIMMSGAVRPGFTVTVVVTVTGLSMMPVQSLRMMSA